MSHGNEWGRMCTLCGGNQESHDADQERLKECPWKDDMTNHPDTPGKGKSKAAHEGTPSLADCPWKGLRGHPTVHEFRSHSD